MKSVSKDAILGALVTIVMALAGFQFDMSQNINTLKYTKANSRSTSERFEKLELQNGRIEVILENQTNILKAVVTKLDLITGVRRE